MAERVKLVLWTAVGVVVAAVAAVTVLVVANYDGRSAGSPLLLPTTTSADCADTVIVYFRTDEEMTAAAAELREDPRVASVRTETKAEAYERFKEIFADQPELVEMARPETMPASVKAGPARDVDSERLADQLLAELRGDDAQVVPCLLR
jgi:cell division protein FtsX